MSINSLIDFAKIVGANLKIEDLGTYTDEADGKEYRRGHVSLDCGGVFLESYPQGSTAPEFLTNRDTMAAAMLKEIFKAACAAKAQEFAKES